MKALVLRFMKDTSGATAIEYGLIDAGISVAIIAVVQGLGTKLKATFKSVSTISSNAKKCSPARTPGLGLQYQPPSSTQ